MSCSYGSEIWISTKYRHSRCENRELVPDLRCKSSPNRTWTNIRATFFICGQSHAIYAFPLLVMNLFSLSEKHWKLYWFERVGILEPLLYQRNKPCLGVNFGVDWNHSRFLHRRVLRYADFWSFAKNKNRWKCLIFSDFPHWVECFSDPPGLCDTNVCYMIINILALWKSRYSLFAHPDISMFFFVYFAKIIIIRWFSAIKSVK